MPFDIFVRFKNGAETTFENVTEIHFGYESVMSKVRIAFESDIEAQGYTYDITEIAEFEALDKERTLYELARDGTIPITYRNSFKQYLEWKDEQNE